MAPFSSTRHREEQSDEAIQLARDFWIASLALAMTAMTAMTAKTV
jgi:hypothetical protein